MERIIDFLKYRYIALGISFLLFIIFSFGTYLNNGFNWGIDFNGGVKTIVKFEKGVDISQIRSVLTESKISATVQQIGKDENNNYIIGSKLHGEGETSEKSYQLVKEALDKGFKKIEVISIETVGPAIGAYLRKSAIYALIIALVLMMLYLAFRFEFKYSVGVIAAIIHDVILTMAFCGIMGIEVDVPVIAAILTLAGYSVNDTIVIFDRIRENINIESKQTFAEIINKSVTQTLGRTIITSLLTLFAVVAIFIWGGDTLSSFALVLIFGLFAGSYSTIYIASPVVLWWEKLTSK
ncbi:MAG: protein translocase subunit SecF [Spirochaetes bacterium]|nr:protein translocase subunit SecF [Spirochaetota bacterium]